MTATDAVAVVRAYLDAFATGKLDALEAGSLRRKLGRDLIETVRGLGYRMQEGGAP